MLASKSSWWRPSRLYRRPRYSTVSDSSDSTVLPGPSYLGLAKVHKHALSHACLCTLARPKFDPISWPEKPCRTSRVTFHTWVYCRRVAFNTLRYGVMHLPDSSGQQHGGLALSMDESYSTIGSWVEACYSHRQGLEIETWNVKHIFSPLYLLNTQFFEYRCISCSILPI